MKSKISPQQIRRTLYRALATFDKFAGFVNKQIIFSLHGVSTNKWYYNNSPAFIKALVREMIQLGWTPGKLSDLKENTRWGRKNFYLTFDDGYKSVLSISDFLLKNEVYPTAFLIADDKTRDLDQLTTTEAVMDKDDIKKLKKMGWEFGSHSMTHRDFYGLKNKEQITKEVSESKTKLTKKYNIDVKYFAYPRGRYTPAVIKCIKETGYKFALTMDDSIINTDTKNYLVPRVGLNSTHSVEEAIHSSSPSVVLLRSIIKEILKKIKYL